MIVHSRAPLNAEPDLSRLRSNFLTPEQEFYVRSHGTVPNLSDAHRLRIGGLVSSPRDISLNELKRDYPRSSVTAVLQCAGNRRADLQRVAPVSGDPWQAGAIGNAVWTGVPLASLLQAAGAHPDARHVAFAACDEANIEGERFNFGVSIPSAKALAPEVMIAYEMNGEPLAPEHGFPLRAVVPGYAGIRSAKWLCGIEVRDTPSDNHFQQRDYKLLPPHMSKQTADWDQGVTINAMPLNAAICEPAEGAKFPAGRLDITGYAIATGRGIARVDVSGDGGQTWTQAALDRRDAPWSWVFWNAALTLPRGGAELVARAWDDAGQTQPARAQDVWNFKGYLCAAWHRVHVTAI